MGMSLSEKAGAVILTAAAIGTPLALYYYVRAKLQHRNAEDDDPPKVDEVKRNIWILERRNLVTGAFLPNRREIRTIPNEPLKITFGIDNIFTSNDAARATKFKDDAVNSMRGAVGLPTQVKQKGEEKWNPLIQHMKATLRQELAEPGGCIRLADLVQFITLNVSLKYLFKNDSKEQKLEDHKEGIKFIAARVNHLWMKTKVGNLENLPQWSEESTMHEHLHNITGCDPMSQEVNPMNFILPAYETMWRAVLRGLLEIYFRKPTDSDPKQWQSILATYLSEPTVANWKRKQDDFQLGTIDIIKEILRLYPPTRRIKRKYPNEDIIKEADLEEMHRHPRLAGDDAENFRPDRWVTIKKEFASNQSLRISSSVNQQGTAQDISLKQFEEETLGFMPFARVCPAGKETTQAFGWKMIALLIASLIEVLKGLEGEWNLRTEKAEDDLSLTGEALKSGRHDYLTLVLEKA